MLFTIKEIDEHVGNGLQVVSSALAFTHVGINRHVPKAITITCNLWKLLTSKRMWPISFTIVFNCTLAIDYTSENQLLYTQPYFFDTKSSPFNTF